MTPTQSEFFKRLCGEFPKRALFSKVNNGKTLTYLRAPTIMNRLDDVAGPDGWDVEYKETDRGYTCKLGILIPTGDNPDTKVWLYKEDGGGFEGMTKKSGGATIEDSDNDEKSAYTNAFRRAAMAWGIGRYLYGCGVAEYLGAEPVIPAVEPETPPAPAKSAPAASQPPAGGRPAPAGRPAPQRQAPQAGGNGGGNYDNFAVPKSGRALFAWAKGLEGHFGTQGIVKYMDQFAKDRGYKGKYVDYDQVMVEDVAWAAIEELKTWPCYQGEFDHVEMPESLADPQ